MGSTLGRATASSCLWFARECDPRRPSAASKQAKSVAVVRTFGVAFVVAPIAVDRKDHAPLGLGIGGSPESASGASVAPAITLLLVFRKSRLYMVAPSIEQNVTPLARPA